MTTQFDPNDPFAVASNPTPREYYGQMDCDAAFVVLQKGVGKTPFNADVHDPQMRRVNLTLTLAGLAEMNMQKPLVRDMLDNDVEWYKTTMPSMKSLQIPTGRELNGRWVKVILVNTREVPTASGGTFQKTAWKLLAVYADEAACQADYAKAHGAQAHSVGDAGATAPAPDDAGKEKATTSLFLAALLKPEIATATTPAQAMARAGLVIEKNALLAKHFTLHSPEVAAAVAAKFGERTPVAAPKGYDKYPSNMAQHTAVELAAIANATEPVEEFPL